MWLHQFDIVRITSLDVRYEPFQVLSAQVGADCWRTIVAHYRSDPASSGARRKKGPRAMRGLAVRAAVISAR
jgi:hypothetical protein